jgi:YD repeat-containing protein
VDATGTLSPPVASFEHLGHHVSRSIAGNGVSTAYTFRGDGEAPVSGDHSFGMKPVRCVVTNGSGAVLSDSSISRDAAQLATSISTSFSATPAGPSRTTSLVRDGMGRVTGWSTSRRDGLGLPPVVENEVSYTLNPRGDRIYVFGGHDPGSYTQSAALPPGDAQRARYTTWPRGSLEWDANRNLTRIPYSDITHTMQYDALGRLVSIKNEATGSPIAEYSFDGLNRLLTLTVHGGSVPHFTRFIYDGSVCIQELGGDGVADLTHVVSDGIRHCISTRNGTIYYPHSSSLAYIGPCDASELITSATGAVVEHRTCDGDGKPIYLSPDGLPSSTGTSVTPIRWTAPECLSVPNTRTCTCGTGYYVSSIGKVVGRSYAFNNGPGTIQLEILASSTTR